MAASGIPAERVDPRNGEFEPRKDDNDQRQAGKRQDERGEAADVEVLCQAATNRRKQTLITSHAKHYVDGQIDQKRQMVGRSQ